MTSRLITFVFSFIGVALLLSTTASAYIDPATTAMLTQIIAGVFITLGVVFGVFRRKIIFFFKNMSINRTKRKLEKQAEKQDKVQSNTQESVQDDSHNETTNEEDSDS